MVKVSVNLNSVELRNILVGPRDRICFGCREIGDGYFVSSNAETAGKLLDEVMYRAPHITGGIIEKV